MGTKTERRPAPRAACGRKAWTAALLSLGILAVGAPAVVAEPAGGSGSAATCGLRNQRHQDNLGNSFTVDLYCDNLATDVLGRSAFNAPVTGRLKLSPSWFVCWTEGEAPPGQTKIWYYTQGDEVVTQPGLKAWGVVPARVVQTPRHPYPGIPRCAWV
ncbi:hypothetical protein [Streptomyces albireticuli]|uniref:Uncharacterized protein n=1 Tax=Streptomyces albireticuli TaxID=1940 RepID=A0A2A2D9J7_9ACTN|nr:hypothetical protein [Streptomyces albireticuli]MCD9141452.1 hypothetical protein [Streptomyces albireticuli]MCD9160587.1 hypothetical protein [Streptomyces albireticuli]MCD9195857.1 hypothetical protein [Streptomyces albireticuli]PAU48040.1 hypothetical protein CK936_15465 [Streptomyces albireticuli]